ncbi:MAG TPA: HPr kinase/phosphatase C-terminal domain-containing protein [Xanthobacteraceae bacterium]|nr:HPr kinase/phosphatase C-terminal domain-containing protein [Xanthobacteraceae bacterium]
MIAGSKSVHATAILAGPRAVLVRGPSGAGKSKLAWSLLQAANDGRLLFAKLIADDRVQLTAMHGKLIAAAPASLAGKIELRGKGIEQVEHEPFGVVGLVIDLGVEDADRMPEPEMATVEILGVRLPRRAIPAGADPLPVLMNALEQAG